MPFSLSGHEERKGRGGRLDLWRKRSRSGWHFAIFISTAAAGRRRKMAALMLWLLGVGVLFLGSDAQEAYDDLPEILRIGVDLALTNVNNHSSIQQHFLFFNSVSQMKEEVKKKEHLKSLFTFIKMTFFFLLFF